MMNSATILKRNIQNIIEENSLLYADYVIRNRALPNIADGLKPVYRKILYTMHFMGANKLTKSQDVEGSVMKFHPHAGSYPTIVGMVQKDNNVIPLIEGKGNFAQHTSRDLQAAAARYTEIKLSPLSKDIFKNLNKDIVKWIPNFDGTRTMPEVLPVKFPMILTIAQEGIAYGMSNKMPSFNLNEVCEAIIKYIETGEEVELIPDFATGGILALNKSAISQINKEGKGSVVVRAKATIDEAHNRILITEIPYSTTREAIIESIVKLHKEKKLSDIVSLKDLTGLKGMAIEIVCKKNTNLEAMLEDLYSYTPLESSYACNMNILNREGLPQVMGVWTIIKEWLKWREECIVNNVNGELRGLELEKHNAEALFKISNYIEEVINIIRFSKEDKIEEELKSKFELTNVQAEYIAGLRLKRLNKEYIQKRVDEIKVIDSKIVELKKIIESDEIKLDIIKSDMYNTIKDFGTQRRTEFKNVDIVKAQKAKVAKEVKDYNVTVFITKNGFIKKVTNVNGKHKLTAGDEIIEQFETRNSAELIAFVGTDAYKIKISNIKDCKVSDMGEYIYNYIDTNEPILGYTVLDDKNKFIMICYESGKIAKVDLQSFATKNNTKRLKNSLCEDSKVVNILTFQDEEKFIIVNARGKEVETESSSINLKKTRNTQGVNTIKNVVNIKRCINS